jgi:hypothetical protein
MAKAHAEGQKEAGLENIIGEQKGKKLEDKEKAQVKGGHYRYVDSR